jgi:SAM-dependent methyltransferase
VSFDYVGSELELFADAIHWKRYFADQMRPFMGSRVLEVGAGIGGTTRVLCRGGETRWLCVEPDAALAQQVRALVDRGVLPRCCETRVGTLADLRDEAAFDTVLYVDTLEHIEDDRDELRRAAGSLDAGGHLLVLAPAHQWLFSAFDRSIGHHRRYTRRSLAAIGPGSLELVKLIYLDSVGLLASLANRVLLRSPMPTRRQIAVWDRLLVPASRAIDPILGGAVGKSVFAVWRRRPGDSPRRTGNGGAA